MLRRFGMTLLVAALPMSALAAPGKGLGPKEFDGPSPAEAAKGPPAFVGDLGHRSPRGQAVILQLLEIFATSGTVTTGTSSPTTN